MFEDFARRKVAHEKAYSFRDITLIYVAVGLTLPTFTICAQIGYALGLQQALLSTAVAGIILSMIGGAAGWIGGHAKLSTYYIVQIAFGRYGAYFVNILLAAVIFGWFGITLNLFAGALRLAGLWPEIPDQAWIILGGIFMTASAVWGFKGLRWLSYVAVPAIILTMLWVWIQALGQQNEAVGQGLQHTQGTMSFGGAVAMQIGGWTVGATVMPDIARYARSPRDGAWGAAGFFMFGLVAISALSIVPVIVMGQPDIIQAMLYFGIPGVTLAVIALSTWSTNDNNLYSSSLGLAAVIPRLPKWSITLVCGIGGTVLALFDIFSYFVPWLMLLGVFIPSIAGVYIADYIFNRARYSTASVLPVRLNVPNVIIWIFSVIVAYMTLSVEAGGAGYMQLTTLPPLDGLCVAFAGRFLFEIVSKYQRR